jgi:hypothetical protein
LDDFRLAVALVSSSLRTGRLDGKHCVVPETCDVAAVLSYQKEAGYTWDGGMAAAVLRHMFVVDCTAVVDAEHRHKMAAVGCSSWVHLNSGLVEAAEGMFVAVDFHSCLVFAGEGRSAAWDCNFAGQTFVNCSSAGPALEHYNFAGPEWEHCNFAGPA